MNKEQALEILQEKARCLSEREDILLKCGQVGLSELTGVQRMLNFKVQDIIREKPQSEIPDVLEALERNLFDGIENNRDRRIPRLAELYSVALDYFYEAKCAVYDYLFVE